MDLKRGDTQVFYVTVPKSIATDGTVMYFMAKIKPDDDKNDSAALISKNSTDKSNIGDNVRFRFELTPNDTNKIEFGNKSVLELAGEFEIRTPDGKVYSVPGKNKYIKIKVYADIRRGGTL